MNSMDVFLRRAKGALDQPKDDCLTVVFRGLTPDEKREIINTLHLRHGARRSLRRRPARHDMAQGQDLNDGDMNMINDGGPAFPVWELNGKGQPEMTGFGMTLRDYFAAKAMQGLLADRRHYENYREIASDAYLLADTMLKAREASND